MLKVLKSGLFTTIQDAGRFGYLNKGVPVAGFMDTASAHKVNQLLENTIDSAVMEITMTGPILEFDNPTFICIGGAKHSVALNNDYIENFKVYKVSPGDILSFGKLEKGFRSYLAIKNGFKTDVILGSRSMYAPVTPRSHLEDNQTIAYESCEVFSPKIDELKVDSFLDSKVLTVSKGPEYGLLDDRRLEVLFFQNFTIANENDRMAYQLVEHIVGHKVSMLTSATLPGTVQLTPSGKIMILMKDGQTTGGYPRIFQLSDKAISILAQKKFGDIISFRLV
ncbi:5-oxoprolinase subunit C family protein [Ulvibacterium marinum]|uniref:Biotin-dependent carboxyltransferase n=1 Tax=Ulvibacterium marinum TaxID=2419782 RepID=A0A3B0C6K3_9FLAO|nr:biotin-dependent carboxyltransferase family protein [Ulvibacterium marinum]RKN81302.1 biotin-dependent carboxyltransferase [Ulvibacterium marinum]